MMTKEEAANLEKSLTTQDQAYVRREGTVKITNTDTGEETISAIYSAAEVLKLLAQHDDVRTVISLLDKVDR